MSLSISDQLRPIKESYRGKYPLVRPIVTVTAQLSGVDKTQSARIAREQILKWLQARVGKLPPEAWDGDDFEHMTPGRFSAGVRIELPDGEYWSVRCDDPDKLVAGRTWTTEAAVARRGDVASFGARLVMATSEADPKYVSSVPGIVRQLCDGPGLVRNGRSLSSQPLIVDTDESLDQLVSLITDPRRRNPVFVASLDEAEVDSATAAIDAHNLATRCLGIGHVAVLAGQQAFGLSDIFGKSLSVFRRAVRTYQPGMTLDDDPFRHPLALPHQIETWSGGGSEQFTNMLIETAARNSIFATDEVSDLPPFTKVKQVALQQQRESARGDHDYPALLALAEDELLEKGREIQTLESMVAEEEQRRRSAEERLAELDGTNAFLRSRIVEVEKRQQARLVDGEEPFPADYSKLDEWVEDRHFGRVRITARAMRDAKAAEFADVSLVYRCLDYLGTEFWRMKTEGGADLLRANEEALRALGVRNELCGAEHLLRERGDTFTVQWGTRRRLLDWHLKNGGNTRDPSRCLRVYYFWDEESQQVVVGSLPGHLETRAS